MEYLSFINKDFNEKIDKKIEIIHLPELYEDVKVLKYKDYYNISKFRNTTGLDKKIYKYLKTEKTSRQLQESVMGLHDNIAESLEQIF